MSDQTVFESATQPGTIKRLPVKSKILMKVSRLKVAESHSQKMVCLRLHRRLRRRKIPLPPCLRIFPERTTRRRRPIACRCPGLRRSCRVHVVPMMSRVPAGFVPGLVQKTGEPLPPYASLSHGARRRPCSSDAVSAPRGGGSTCRPARAAWPVGTRVPEAWRLSPPTPPSPTARSDVLAHLVRSARRGEGALPAGPSGPRVFTEPR